MPAFANDQAGLCKQLESLADAGKDGQPHQVRLIWSDDGDRASCDGTGVTESRICRWLERHEASRYPVNLSQESLECLGWDPLPPEDPDSQGLPLNAHWTRGAFHAESGSLVRAHQTFTMDMNLPDEAGPRWILFTASPKRPR